MPKCKYCKSKRTRKNRVQENGNIQYQCKDCKRLFTVQAQLETKVEKKVQKKSKEAYEEVEEYEIDRQQAYIWIVDYMFEETEDLESRLEHADKVNLANIEFIKEKDKTISRAINDQDKHYKEKHDLSMRIQHKNVIIWFLVAWLAILSAFFFL